MMHRVLTALSLAALVGAAIYTSTAPTQSSATVQFSHKLHVEEVEIACADCHTEAATSDASSDNLLPPRSVCLDCHEEESITSYGYTGEAGPARELIFSHRNHIETQGLDCQDCHTEIAKATSVPSGLPEMDNCLKCHAQHEMNDNCSVCHSQVELRRPKDHIADWILDHMEVARGDAGTCASCHSQTYCQECHDGAALGMAIDHGTDAPVDRIGPMAASHDGQDIMILQRVHDLNYRYTHGSDVRAKTSDCGTCHDAETFCAACHNPEDDASRFKPIWHEVANFRFVMHAEYARRDIETCAGCHDQSGADPVCLTCHRTTVSPHPEGFMQDVKGPWHDDDNAICFVCHDPVSRITGIGFCARCHEAK